MCIRDRGESNPAKLASLRHGNCHKSEAEIAAALQSNGRKDFLFALQQELDTYDHLQKKIAECDVMIDQMLNEIIDNDDNKKQHYIDPKSYKRINKNTPKDIDPVSYTHLVENHRYWKFYAMFLEFHFLLMLLTLIIRIH